MKGVKIFIADGFEDIEALATYDVLQRGGVEVELVRVGEGESAESSHGVRISVPSRFEELSREHEGTGERDFMIFPGGMPGSKNLAECEPLISLMKEHYAAGGSVAAICAAPGLVISQLEGLEGRRVTCFDGFEGYLEAKGAVFTGEPAVRDGRIITGRSAGHAVSFGLEILKAICGDEKAEEVRHAMYLD